MEHSKQLQYRNIRPRGIQQLEWRVYERQNPEQQHYRRIINKTYSDGGDDRIYNENLHVKTFSAYFTASYKIYVEFAGPTYFTPHITVDGRDRFFATFTRNKNSETESPKNLTAIFCTPAYYEQQVTATIDSRTKSPLTIAFHREKQSLSHEIFNRTSFETVVAAGLWPERRREDKLPLDTFPRYLEQLLDKDLTPAVMTFGESFDKVEELPPMLAMTMSMWDKPLQGLLDPKTLKEAYQQAYQLLFARAMVDILETNLRRTPELYREFGRNEQKPSFFSRCLHISWKGYLPSFLWP